MKKLISLLVLVVLVAAGCGDDDKPTGPAKNPLLGTWTFQDDEGLDLGVGATMTFEDDGTMAIMIGESGVTLSIPGTWSVAGNRLTLGLLGGVFSYEIKDRELTFATVEAGFSDLANYAFETAGDPAGSLTGVTWVDEDDDELVFHSDGTYRWGEDFEEGTWTAEGRTVTVHLTSSLSYVVSGSTLTLTNSDGEESVLTKE